MFVDRLKLPQEIIDQVRAEGYVSTADVSELDIKASSDGRHLANDRIDGYFNLAYREFLRYVLGINSMELADKGFALSASTKHVDYSGGVTVPKRFPIFTGLTGLTGSGFEVVQIWDAHGGLRAKKPLVTLGMVIVLNKDSTKEPFSDEMRFKLNSALLKINS